MLTQKKTKTKGRKIGRMNSREREALNTLLPMVSISPDTMINKIQIFGRDAPVYMEIGFGNGEFFLEQAINAPESDFIGIEIYRTGIAKLLTTMVGTDHPPEISVPNIRIFNDNAGDVLSNNIPAGAIDGAYILFPDPWQKKRHNKRRLVTPQFASLLFSKIKTGGFTVAATDHEEYAGVIEHSFIHAGFIMDREDMAGVRKTTYALKALKENNTLNIFRFIKP